MVNFDNLTPYAAVSLPSMAPDNSDLWLVVVSGRFALPAGPGITELRRTPEQPAVRMADMYFGAPECSSLRHEGQSAPFKGATDVLLLGHAWAPFGRPVTRVDVTITVEQRLTKTVAVFGDRSFGLGGRIGAPAPFTKMPLVWERAFGGAVAGEAQPRPFEPMNPVGRGFHASPFHASDQPVPNVEDPADLMVSSSHRPRPTGLGPVAKHWQPRVRWAGTFDQRWVEERAPQWPADLDTRYFQAAPMDQQLRPHLSGGEAFTLAGVHRDGLVRFVLPRERMLFKGYLKGRVVRKVLTLDQVSIEPDEGVVTLTWRAGIALPNGMFEHERSLVRLLEPWEQ